MYIYGTYNSRTYISLTIPIFCFSFNFDSSGFYCESKNQNGKPCEDYKIRFCCAKPKVDQWEDWSKWSKCSKSCGSGKKFRTRRCISANAHGKPNQVHKCYGQDNPDYSKNEEDCNIEDCPGIYCTKLVYVDNSSL